MALKLLPQHCSDSELIDAFVLQEAIFTALLSLDTMSSNEKATSRTAPQCGHSTRMSSEWRYRQGFSPRKGRIRKRRMLCYPDCCRALSGFR